uniref:Uncharacterized protein n=1 Tax=Eutreptiella gymnastica TaxID=73025 RepID=A0A7S4GI84_9EUGL
MNSIAACISGLKDCREHLNVLGLDNSCGSTAMARLPSKPLVSWMVSNRPPVEMLGTGTVLPSQDYSIRSLSNDGIDANPLPPGNLALWQSKQGPPSGVGYATRGNHGTSRRTAGNMEADVARATACARYLPMR